MLPTDIQPTQQPVHQKDPSSEKGAGKCSDMSCWAQVLMKSIKDKGAPDALVILLKL